MTDDQSSKRSEKGKAPGSTRAEVLLRALEGTAQHIRAQLLSYGWPGQPDGLNYDHMQDLHDRLAATESILGEWLEANAPD